MTRATPKDRHIGRLITQRRVMLRLNQDQLAHSIGISGPQLSKYEKGVNRVAASRIPDLAKALNVHIMYFFDGLP